MANNLFADVPAACVAKQTIDFATAGFDSTNTRIIYEVGSPLKSFVPGRSINAVTGFTSDKGYYIVPKISMDKTAYLAPPLPTGGATTLNAPTSVTLGTATTTTQPITWTDTNSSPNEVNYKIQFRLAGVGSFTDATVTGLTATGGTVTGLTANTSYDYRVIAVGDGSTTADSVASSTATGSTATSAATIASTAWWMHYDPADSNKTTAVSGSDTLLVALWNKMNAVGYPGTPQGDTLQQVTTANQPYLRASGINGLPSIEIDSTPRAISTVSVNTKAKPITRIIVIQPKTVPAAEKYFGWSGSPAGMAGFGWKNTGKLFMYGGDYLEGTSSAVVDTKYILWGEFTADGSAKLYINGTLEATGSAGTQADAVQNVLGNIDTTSANVWIGQDLIYEGLFSSTDRDAITNELKTKFGIS